MYICPKLTENEILWVMAPGELGRRRAQGLAGLLLMLPGAFDTIDWEEEGSHSGRVRAPAKRLTRESGFMGSNPIPSATEFQWHHPHSLCCLPVSRIKQ